MLRIFWSVVVLLGVFVASTTRVTDAASIMAGIVIIAASLVPAYLAAKGRVQGTPIFPVYAISGIWLYALPVLMKHPLVAVYEAHQHLQAALVVVLHFIVGTVVWYVVARRPIKPPRRCHALRAGEGDTVFLALFLAAGILTVGLQGGWFGERGLVPIDPRILNIAQRLIFGLVNLTILLFSYRWGKKELSESQRWVFAFSFLLMAISTTTTLYLLNLLSMTVLFTIGFTLGRRRIPWLLLAVVFPIVSVLHYGKQDMRDIHWTERQAVRIQPTQYFSWYREWAMHARDNIPWLASGEMRREAERSNILERTSLMHLLLRVQHMSPEEIPYLRGRTYTIIPELMIPRIFHPNRPSTIEGVRILSVHYRLLSADAARRTTIGWGLLNEAVANFGVAGAVLLGALLGFFYGQLSRLSLGAPLLSFRVLFTFIVLGIAIFFEYSLSVYVTSLFQTCIPLLLLRWFIMKPVDVAREPATRRQRSGAPAALPVASADSP